MALLHHKIGHPHPLVFHEDTGNPSNNTYYCTGCTEAVSGGPSYSCSECELYLHKRCAEAPSKIRHPDHRDHPLFLLSPEDQKSEVSCSLCDFAPFNGFFYHCFYCEFYLHVGCSFLPNYTSAGNLIEIENSAHQHALISVNTSHGYFDCDDCSEPIMDASYACFRCRKFFHEKCLELPTEINHPSHRKHRLLLVSSNFDDYVDDSYVCILCQSSQLLGFVYICVPCKVMIHVRCAWPPPIIEDKFHHQHPFTLLLRPNNPFDCNACGKQGNHVSYICSPCNIQVHRDCISLPRHIRLNVHPHPVSHHFSHRIDHHDSRDWDCMICYKKVNIEHGSYYCSRPGCHFVIHVECSIEAWSFYDIVEVENPDELDESYMWYEPTSCITEREDGDGVIVTRIKYMCHNHVLSFSDEIKDTKYCNGCMLPIISSFFNCSRCDFFLHKACAELPRMLRMWLSRNPFRIQVDGVFVCDVCHYESSGFSYQLIENGRYLYHDSSLRVCFRCVTPHSFVYQADEPHLLFFDYKYEGICSACAGHVRSGDAYRCKDCTYALHRRCVTLPRTAWHKCDQHSLTLAYRDPDDYPLRHYCDICEEERDPQQWFYHCETCDKAMHTECVLGKYPFIGAGRKYRYHHPHRLTFVRKIYYYPECDCCGEPCQDLALECEEDGCKYIVHWSCIRPDSDSDSDC